MFLFYIRKNLFKCYDLSNILIVYLLNDKMYVLLIVCFLLIFYVWMLVYCKYGVWL